MPPTEPGSASTTMAKPRGNPWGARGIVLIGAGLLSACGLLITGGANVYHAQQLAAHGITTQAVVTENHGYGPDAVLVRYTTTGGQREQGILNTPAQAAAYPRGSELTVIYDPADPQTVTFPGAGNGGWAEIAAGASLLLSWTVIGLVFAVLWRHAARRRRPANGRERADGGQPA